MRRLNQRSTSRSAHGEERLRECCGRFGIAFPTAADLAVHERTVEEVRIGVVVDSLGYLSVDGLLSAVSGPPQDYCTACFTGRYLCPAPEPVDKFATEVR